MKAIQKSHGAQHAWLIRTIASSCLQYGFSAAPSGDGYVLKPVNGGPIAIAIRRACPGETRKLTEIVNSPQCQRYFSMVYGAAQPNRPRSGGYVIMHLWAVTCQPVHRSRVNHLLLKVEMIQKHPRDLNDGNAAQHLPAHQNTVQTPQAVPAITQPLATFAVSCLLFLSHFPASFCNTSHSQCRACCCTCSAMCLLG